MNTSPRPELVLVTGATRGLGLAIARRLLADGLRVVGTGRAAVPATEALAAETDGRFVFAPLDLHDTARLHGFVREIVAAHGPLYGLVNNAALGHDGVLATMHDSQIGELLKVNVEAPILLAKYCARSMLLQ